MLQSWSWPPSDPGRFRCEFVSFGEGLQVMRRRSGTGSPAAAEDGRVRRPLPEPAFGAETDAARAETGMQAVIDFSCIPVSARTPSACSPGPYSSRHRLGQYAQHAISAAVIKSRVA